MHKLSKLSLATGILCLLATMGIAEVTPSFPDPPELIYRNENGDSYRIVGYQNVIGKSRPYYFDNEGVKRYITSLEGIALKGTPEQVTTYSILPDSYFLSQTTANPAIGKKAEIVLTELLLNPYTLNLSEHKANEALCSIFWIRNQEQTPIYLNRPVRELLATTIELPNSHKTGAEIDGYPVLTFFLNGIAIPPSPQAHSVEKMLKAELPESGEIDTLLEVAARSGFSDFVESHLETAKNLNKDAYLDIAYAAVSTSHLSTLKLLLPVPSENEKVNLPLKTIPFSLVQTALKRGHRDILLYLLQHPKLDQRHDQDRSFLTLSLIAADFDIAEMLSQAGFPLEGSRDLAREAAKTCLIFNRLDFFEALASEYKFKAKDLADRRHTTVFHRVAPFADVDTLDRIKEFGIPIDKEDQSSYTPLILAAGFGNIPAVCWFIDQGARIDHKNSYGHTALQYSIIKKQEEATYCLLEQGSDVNLPGPKGVTPLMQAALFRDQIGASAIAELGGIWNLDSEYLDPCLEFVLQQDLAKVLEISLQQGLSRDYRIRNKWPLNWLANYFGATACQALTQPHPFSISEIDQSDQIELKLDLFDRELESMIALNQATPDSIELRVLITSKGKTMLPVLETKTGRFLENYLRKLFTGLIASDVSSLLPNDASALSVEIRYHPKLGTSIFSEKTTILSTYKVSLPQIEAEQI